MTNKIQALEDGLANAVYASEKIQLMNDLAWELRDTDQQRARSLSEDAHALSTSVEFTEIHFAQGVAASLRTLGYLNILSGNFTTTLSQSLQALAALENNPHTPTKIDVLRSMSWSFTALGEFAQALDLGIEALKLAYEINDTYREAMVLDAISNVYANSNLPKQAIESCQKALHIYEKLGQKQGVAIMLNNMAVTYGKVGNYPDALYSALKALKLAHENGLSSLMLTALGTVGEVYRKMGDYDQAKSYLQEYLSRARDCRNKLEEFQALLDLGEMHYVRGEDESAIFYLHQALILEQEQVSHKGRVKCHDLLAELYQRQGNLEFAFTHLNQSKSLLELLFNQETAKKIAGLQVIHQIESSRREAEIYHIKNDELQKEIEERKKAQAIAEQFAITDPLTGLFNRRHFFYLAEREIARAIRNKRPVSAIMLDLDHFKKVNDTYGHAMGDRVLSEAATIIRDNLRAIDIIGRYGGEEFVILLPETDILQAEQVAERIRNSTTQRPFGTNEEPVFISMSLGVASLYQNEDMDHPTVDILLDWADKALYVAKQGRDQTVVFEHIPRESNRASS